MWTGFIEAFPCGALHFIALRAWASRSCRDGQFLLLVQKEPKHAKEGLPLFRISPLQFRRQGSASLTGRASLPPPYFSFKKEKLSKRKIPFGSAPFPQCPALKNLQRNCQQSPAQQASEAMPCPTATLPAVAKEYWILKARVP